MNIKPRFYQEECAQQVFKLVCEGKRKITILVPMGAGKTVISVLIAERICTSYQKALIIIERQEMARACNDMISGMEASSIECITIDDLIAERRNAELYILHSLRPFSRKRFSEYFGITNSSIVVSLGEPCLDNLKKVPDYTARIENKDVHIDVADTVDSIDRLVAYYKKIGNITPLVYSTESIIDIRDIMTASLHEKEILSEQLRADRNKLAHEMIQFSSMPKADSDSELRSIIEKQKRKIEYYEQLLVSCGISKDVLDEEFEKIEALREELKDDFYYEDGTINEAVISRFESAVAESVVRTTKHVLTLENRDRYVDILRELLSEDVWVNKISEESKTYLITAKMNYELMLQMENKKELDFSGVCLLVTKALDVEVARRLYNSYVNYLGRRFAVPRNISSWPNSMLDKTGTGILDEKDFTLGTVPFVVGIDKDGVIRNRYVFTRFKEFAKDELYKRSVTDADREKKITNMVRYVEKVRVDYRNPSAHRNSLDLVTAEACMDYMLETYKIIKEILEDMRK